MVLWWTPQEDSEGEKDGSMGRMVHQASVREISTDSGVATLVISSAGRRHAGTYTCAPPGIPKSASVLLHVLNGEFLHTNPYIPFPALDANELRDFLAQTSIQPRCSTGPGPAEQEDLGAPPLFQSPALLHLLRKRPTFFWHCSCSSFLIWHYVSFKLTICGDFYYNIVRQAPKISKLFSLYTLVYICK